MLYRPQARRIGSIQLPCENCQNRHAYIRLRLCHRFVLIWNARQVVTLFATSLAMFGGLCVHVCKSKILRFLLVRSLCLLPVGVRIEKLPEESVCSGLKCVWFFQLHARPSVNLSGIRCGVCGQYSSQKLSLMCSCSVLCGICVAACWICSLSTRSGRSQNDPEVLPQAKGLFSHHCCGSSCMCVAPMERSLSQLCCPSP